MGDAVLVEFPSPIQAVRCAVDIRIGLALAAQNEQRPFRMRFGLHLADVLIEGEDLIGDGVNLAARIQQAADVDAIDISGALFEQIRRTSPFAFDDRGEQTFRNFGEPIRVYRLRGERDRHVYQLAPTQPKPVQAKRPHSLALAPFEVSSGNEDQRYLAEGLTEELIFELGRFKRLFVTSRSATRALDATALDPQAVGERLGVRYVLTGAIRQIGSRIRVSLSLSETETGGVVWSDRFDERLEGLVDRMDEMVSRIASTVLGRIEESDIASARRLKPESMTAYEFHLRGLERLRVGGVIDENYREAVRWFERAIEADHYFARPLSMLVCALAGLPGFDLDDGERFASGSLGSSSRARWMRRIAATSTPLGNMSRKRWNSARRMPTSGVAPARSTYFRGSRNGRCDCLTRRPNSTLSCRSGASRNAWWRYTTSRDSARRSRRRCDCRFRLADRACIVPPLTRLWVKWTRHLKLSPRPLLAHPD
jgi:adenylate cyclase